MIRLSALLTCLAIAGCAIARPQETAVVEPGGNVTLAPGTIASVKAAKLQVRFIAVTEDSRCPRDVACIWAGEVKVLLEIQPASKVKSQVELPEGGSTVVGDYRVRLVQVEPQRLDSARPAPQDYRVTLTIGRVN
jgi:hypothetical protein